MEGEGGGGGGGGGMYKVLSRGACQGACFTRKILFGILGPLRLFLMQSER